MRSIRIVTTTILMFFATAAFAECFMRSATVSDTKKVIGKIADVTRTVTPQPNNQFKCNVVFRIELDGVWHTAEGNSMGSNGDSIDQICSQAFEFGRSRILQRVAGNSIMNENEMVCRDDPIPSVKTVKVGDLVRISEMAPHPKKPNFFAYKGASCRWFIETDFDPVHREIIQYQGIVCMVRKDEWRVIDKF